MKNYVRLLVACVCVAASMYTVPAKAMVGVVSSDGQQLAMAGRLWVPAPVEKTVFEKCEDNVVSAAKYTAAATCVWSVARQYQIALEHGWRALCTHQNSWPVFMWGVCRDVASAAKEGAKDLGKATYDAAKKGAQYVGSSAKEGAKSAGKAAYGYVKPVVTSVYANHHDACTVVGTAVAALGVVYTAKLVCSMLAKKRAQSIEATPAVAPVASCCAPVLADYNFVA